MCRLLVWVVWSPTRWSWVSRTTGVMETWEIWRFTPTRYSKNWCVFKKTTYISQRCFFFPKHDSNLGFVPCLVSTEVWTVDDVENTCVLSGVCFSLVSADLASKLVTLKAACCGLQWTCCISFKLNCFMSQRRLWPAVWSGDPSTAGRPGYLSHPGTRYIRLFVWISVLSA